MTNIEKIGEPGDDIEKIGEPGDEATCMFG